MAPCFALQRRYPRFTPASQRTGATCSSSWPPMHPRHPRRNGASPASVHATRAHGSQQTVACPAQLYLHQHVRQVSRLEARLGKQAKDAAIARREVVPRAKAGRTFVQAAVHIQRGTGWHPASCQAEWGDGRGTQVAADWSFDQRWTKAPSQYTVTLPSRALSVSTARHTQPKYRQSRDVRRTALDTTFERYCQVARPAWGRRKDALLPVRAHGRL
jgi:hypothetical protein